MKTYANTIRQLGYCCSVNFFERHSNWTTAEIAKKLGLASRTIRLNKQIVREDQTCPGFATCAKKLRQHP